MGYKGKHRAPSNTGRRLRHIGTVGIASTASFILAPTANAATPNEILEAIAVCESGNRNVNNSTGASTASGYLQIINGTWKAYGGSQYASRAIGASRGEQFIVGRAILAGQGLGAWSESRRCWQNKIGKIPTRSMVESVDTNPSSVRTTVKAPERVEKKATTRPKARKAPTLTKDVAKRVAASYVIKRGDTLSKIARKKGTTVNRLVSLNRDSVKNPDLIYAGSSLRLR